MAKKTIAELDEGTDTQTSAAEVAFTQGGSTFKGPIRPNPPTQINIKNQAQLEAELGVDLEIPDDGIVTISVDAAFALDKPIKLGADSALEISSPIIGAAISYTGTGPMIQLTTPGSAATALIVENIGVFGDGTNSFIDIETTSFVVLRGVTVGVLASVGNIQTSTLFANTFTVINVDAGLVIIDTPRIFVNIEEINNSGATGVTLLSIISSIETFATINNVTAAQLFAGDSLFFIDPNSPTGSFISIQGSQAEPSDFYQLGTDIVIDSVANNGSGFARFTTATPHELIVGTPVVISGFSANDPAYNGTFITTAVPTTTTFDTNASFGTTEIGNMNKSSLDQTDVQIVAENNRDSPDSMFTGESGLEIFGSEVTSSSLATDVFEVITSASWTSTKLERFSEGVADTGQLVCDDTATRTYAVSYSATIEKSGGGSLNVGIVILKNGSNIGFNPPHTVNTGKIQISGVDLVELTDTDTIDIAVINYDGSDAAVIISQASLVVSVA